MTQQASLLAPRVGAGRADGGRRYRSVDPAHTGQVVAEMLLAEPATFVGAGRAAPDAQRGWAAAAAPAPAARGGGAHAPAARVGGARRAPPPRRPPPETAKPLAEARGEVQEV